ncbi:MAG: lipid-A-disaccharide synthase-related protein [Pseudanabaenaceae cyanobacterium bins.68]|nr:lipid-A-disaccharide synthase-related protein [Pseudanabaenaceae cyanobacterium bins.68]
MTSKVLFISNGTGEDLNSNQVLQALQNLAPQIEIMALPVVGEGRAYQVPLLVSGRSLPSRGFLYMSSRELLKDLQAGLIGLTLTQINSLLRHRGKFDLVLATGDVVVLAMAWLTGCPYAAFLVSASAYYENRFALPLPTNFLLRSRQCRQIFCRDRYTAELCQAQGLTHAVFAGYPIMDLLHYAQPRLQLHPDLPLVAFLPGSRLPEACQNLGLILELAKLITIPLQFYGAIVPAMQPELAAIATAHGWQYDQGAFTYQHIQVHCRSDMFAEILDRANLVVGMAGTAVEQAVGLGKPVVQLVGQGPQFTYRFAEAQMRLLGKSVHTCSNPMQAAALIPQILQDQAYLAACKANGADRVGHPGGSQAIAQRLLKLIEYKK